MVSAIFTLIAIHYCAFYVPSADGAVVFVGKTTYGDRECEGMAWIRGLPGGGVKVGKYYVSMGETARDVFLQVGHDVFRIPKGEVVA